MAMVILVKNKVLVFVVYDLKESIGDYNSTNSFEAYCLSLYLCNVINVINLIITLNNSANYYETENNSHCKNRDIEKYMNSVKNSHLIICLLSKI